MKTYHITLQDLSIADGQVNQHTCAAPDRLAALTGLLSRLYDMDCNVRALTAPSLRVSLGLDQPEPIRYVVEIREQDSGWLKHITHINADACGALLHALRAEYDLHIAIEPVTLPGLAPSAISRTRTALHETLHKLLHPNPKEPA